jgi:glycosyltransferase involved in cell wall biosynthesis
MTILFYAPFDMLPQPKGSGVYISNLLNALLEIDRSNRYIVWHGCMVKILPHLRPFLFRPPANLQERVSVRVLRLPSRLVYRTTTWAFLWWVGSLPLADLLFGFPQVFFSPFSPFIPYWKGALVLTVFDLTPLTLSHCHLPGTRYAAKLTLLWAKRAKRVLTFSEAVKEQLVDWLGFSPERIVVTPLAPNEQFKPQPPEEVERVRRKYRLFAPYILFVGTVEPRKNLVTLVRAFAAVVKNFPHLLVLAGARGWMSEPVFAEIERQGLKDRVVHLGYVPAEDLPALMSGAEVFVYPSLGEGFGLPPLEAMACGTPVLCSDAPALPEVVGDAAITLPPTEVTAWTEAIQNLLSDRDLREALGQKGLERARQFSWGETARRTLRAFEAAVTSP